MAWWSVKKAQGNFTFTFTLEKEDIHST
jgi:hypothetical protein